MATKSSNRPGVCRCCLAEGNYKDLKSVFYWMGEKEIYYKMLEYCFDITLSNQEDTRGRYSAICELCISRLRDCVEFKKQVLTAEESFTKALDDTFGEGSSGTKFELAIKDEHIKKEMAIEPYGSDEERGMDAADDFSGFDDDLPYEPSEKKAKMSLKVEDGSDGEEVTLATLLKRKSQPMNVPKSDAKNETVKKTKAKKTTVSAKKLIASTKKTTASAKNTTAAIDNAAADETESTNTEAVVYTPKENTPGEISSEDKRTREYKKNNELLLVGYSNGTPFKWNSTRNFICICCDANFTNPLFLKEHTIDHGIEAVLTKLFYISLHKTCLKVDISDLKCRACMASLKSLTDLRQHLIDVHKKVFNNEPLRMTPFVLNNDSFECTLCDKTFNNFFNLNAHMNVHVSKLVCSVCGAGFNSISNLNRHSFTHEKLKYPCTNCDKIFKTPDSLELHKKYAHKGYFLHKCPQCPEYFKHHVQKQKHLVEFHNGNTLKCNLCNKTFVTKGPLYLHMRRDHNAERKHICEVCGKAFFAQNSLDFHKVTHTGEKLFKCDVCNKSYGRKSTLTGHMRIHNNDRKYICGACGKSFIHKCLWQGHIKLHENYTYL